MRVSPPLDAGAQLRIGGLKVIRFGDNHVFFAPTRFALAALAADMAWKASGRCDQPARETLARQRLSTKE